MTSIIDAIIGFFRKRPTPAPVPPPPPPPPAPVPDQTPEAQIASLAISRMNKLRALHGKPPLVEDTRIDASSWSWAIHMAAAGFESHDDFKARIGSVYPNSPAAENVATGQPDAPSVVAWWADSGPHLANILGDYDRVGVGVSLSTSGVPFWCAQFAKLG